MVTHTHQQVWEHMSFDAWPQFSGMHMYEFTYKTVASCGKLLVFLLKTEDDVLLNVKVRNEKKRHLGTLLFLQNYIFVLFRFSILSFGQFCHVVVFIKSLRDECPMSVVRFPVVPIFSYFNLF